MGIFISLIIMSFFAYGILFVFGLIVGSFLNVATLRYDPDKGFLNIRLFGGRSHCPYCAAQLAWYELVPVFSFLVLRGKCRHCTHSLSLQYPVVELLTALVFVAVPARIAAIVMARALGSGAPFFGMYGIVMALWVLLFVLFISLAVIDLRHMIIPDFITIALTAIGGVLTGITQWLGDFDLMHGSFLGHYAMLFGFRDTIWANHIFAAFIGIVFFGLIIGVSRGRAMGLGDLKLAGALGIIFGWPDLALVLMFSFIVGAFVSICLMARGRKTMRDAVPFGPFLVIGAALVFFFGFYLVSSYFSLFAII